MKGGCEIMARIMRDREVVISTIKALQTNFDAGRIEENLYNEIRHAFEMELLALEARLIKVGA